MRTFELSVLCEGLTEQQFVIQVLHRHLSERQIFARPQSLNPRGDGIIPWDELRKAIKTEVGRSKNHQYTTTMIDLYKIGQFPEAEKKAGETIQDRVRRIEDLMKEELPNPRFIPYIQVHEFEGLVFVDLDLLPRVFPDGEAIGAAKKLRRDIGNLSPEEIDDGEQTAPSKRLIRAIPAYKKRKAQAGPILTAQIGLPRLRADCPHFDEWVSRLEQLSQDN